MDRKQCNHEDFYMDSCYICTKCYEQDQERLAALLEAFPAYAAHKDDCAFLLPTLNPAEKRRPCSCGLDDLMKGIPLFEKVDEAAISGWKVRLNFLAINENFRKFDLDLQMVNLGSAPGAGDADNMGMAWRKVNENFRAIEEATK